jgi:tetratricopeptide (TPR) repeat protein
VLVENRRYRYLVPEETVAHAITSLAASQESGDLGQVSRSQFLLGFCYLWRSDLDKARETLQSTLTLAERIGEVDVRLMCLAFLPVIFRKLGRVEETRAMLPRSLAEARERGSLEYEGMARANLAWVALREGNLADAQTNCQAALELWRPPVKLPIMWLAFWPLISVHLARNQIAEAIDAVRVMMAPDLQPLPAALTAIAESTIAAWEKGEVDLARKNLDRAVVLAQELGYL